MSEITTSNDNGGSRKLSFAWLGLYVLVVFAYFFGLTIPLLGPDEPRYAQVAREMFERGDWVTPTLGGANWFEKPALLYWFEIVAYRIFGVSEFSARLGPAIFGLGTILSLWILGRFLGRSENQATNNEPRTTINLSNWFALIAASTLGIIVFSRGASFDIVVTFPITAALVSFYIFDQRRSENFAAKTLPLLLFYVFVGVALLAKGLIGIVFPFAIVTFYHVLSRRWPSRSLLISLVWGTIVSLAVAAVWYVPMYGRHGWQFIDEFIIQQHFQRFTSNKYLHPQPFYFFLWVLPLMTIPWVPFLLASVWSGIRGLFGGRSESSSLRVSASPRLRVSSSPLLLFSLSWLLVPLVFFSLSGSKLPGYILPSVPPAIVMTALWLAPRIAADARWKRAIAAGAVLTLVITIGLGMTVVPKYADGDSVKGLLADAAARGYTSQRVLSLHNVSHNAEFYAAGRLVRDETGKQRRFNGVNEVKIEMTAENAASVLVLVPLEYLPQLTRDPELNAEVIRDNGDLAIVHVSKK